MSNLTESQSQMNNIFLETSIQFSPLEGDGNLTFGKIVLNPNKSTANKKLIELIIKLDNSGSMNDLCPDRKTKLQNMQFAITNALRYLVKHNILVQLTISSFDDTIIKVIERTILTEENIEEIAKQIDKIRPNGGTNIAAVLNEEATFKKLEDDNTDRVFAMFTDGHATVGQTTTTTKLIEIANKINDATTIATFGCGVDHDCKLLSGIAKRKNSSYKFIGKLEEAALIMGEFLDKILYKVLTQVKISIKNGEIYDWQTNSWKTEIATENIVAECNKTYNIRSSTPDEVCITISAVHVETGEEFEHTIINKMMDQDLRKDVFRQKTLECLFETNEYNKDHEFYHTINDNMQIKIKLRDLLKEMKKFMDDNTLREDLFMKLLCDDIVTAFKTIGTSAGIMYTTSRQTSQATQGIHNNVFEEPDIPDMPSMTRGLTTRIQKMNNSISGLQMPSLKRGVSLQIQEIEDDLNFTRSLAPRVSRILEDDEEEEDDDDELPGDLQNCSMNIKPPRLRRGSEEEEDINFNFDDFDQHETLASDVSPYENLKTITLMRDVSYTPKEKEEKEEI